MKTFSSEDAKTEFYKLLEAVEREPVVIVDDDKPVAVAVSMQAFEELEAMKLELLQLRHDSFPGELERGDIHDGPSTMASLILKPDSDDRYYKSQTLKAKNIRGIIAVSEEQERNGQVVDGEELTARILAEYDEEDSDQGNP